MGVATAIAVVGAVGAIASANAAKKGAQAQIDAANANREAFAGIPIPTVDEQKVILQNPDLMGHYTPEQLQAMNENVSLMTGVKADQSTLDAQNQALQGIGEVAKGGYTEGDKATARESEREVNQQAQARRSSILNAMASRGTLGSGMELAAQLQGEQQANDAASRSSDALIANAQARSLQALGQQGSLAGSMNSQQFNQRSDIARAQDAINNFNTQNQQNVANANVGNRNQAQLTNLQAVQNQENQRAATANEQELHNKALLQTEFANKRGQAQDIAGANSQAAAARQGAANANANMYAGIAQGIGTAAAGVASSNAAADQAEKNRQNALAIAQAKNGY